MDDLKGLSALLYQPEPFEIEGRIYKFGRFPLGVLWRTFELIYGVVGPLMGLQSRPAVIAGLCCGLLRSRKDLENLLVRRLRVLREDPDRWVKVSVKSFRDPNRFPLPSLPYLVENLLYHPDIVSFFVLLSRIWKSPLIRERRKKRILGKKPSVPFNPRSLPGRVTATSSGGSRIVVSSKWSELPSESERD